MPLLLRFFLFFGLISTSFSVDALDESNLYKSVLQVRSYDYDKTTNNYNLISFGSSVAISESRIITNAHVIFNTQTQTPYGYYEVCESRVFYKPPICYSLARLISYDLDNDLALLEIEKKKSLSKISLIEQDRYNLATPLIIYGYPEIGGETITRTSGRIAGYADPFYKIDGVIDHGNSGGGAFSESGSLIGIPSQIISDNASIGYMISAKVVGSFLSRKTVGYTRYKEGDLSDFRSFLTKKYSEITRGYGLKNDLVEVKNLRKYGFKILKNTFTTPSGKHMLTEMLYEEKNTKTYLACTTPVKNPLIPYWKDSVTDDTEIVASGEKDIVIMRSYVSKDQYSYIFFHEKYPCYVISVLPLNPKVDKKIIALLGEFLAGGVEFKGTTFLDYPAMTSLFHTERGIDTLTINEYPGWNAPNISLYLENSEKKGSTAGVASYRFDRWKDLTALFLSKPRDDITTTSDLIAAYKKETSPTKTIIRSGKTKSGHDFILSYEVSTHSSDTRFMSPSIVYFYNTGDRPGYMTIVWTRNEPWLTQGEIDILYDWATSITPREEK